MNISEQLNEIINILRDSSVSNCIAILSLMISIIALIANIITNIKNHKQYIDSLKPLICFDFYEMDKALFLAIRNTGKTEAKQIRIEILELVNNGEHNQLDLDDLFKNEFMLYPEEEVQGIIAYSGVNVVEKIFPSISVKISFINGNDNKEVTYRRTISFKKTIYDRNILSKLEDSIESISYSNNRLANYFEGRTLFRFDKLNVFPHNSLYKDIKDAINNADRKDNE